MKPVFVIGGVAIVGIIAVVAVLSVATPQDLDAIIANNDCNALRNLSEESMEGGTTTQQMEIASLLYKCMAGTDTVSTAQAWEIAKVAQKMRDDPTKSYDYDDLYEQTRHIRDGP